MNFKKFFFAFFCFRKQRIVSVLMLCCLFLTGIISVVRPEIKEIFFTPVYEENSSMIHVGEIINTVRIRQAFKVRYRTV
ncbi:MAG: hypothetical protein J5858_12640, partial [Lentisphaeria bacterium]|nr:hypothetical protein [Lentisphaeria bacterium]